MNSQGKRYIEQGQGGSQGQYLLSPCAEGYYPPSVDVFTNLEALQTPYYRSIMEASSCRFDQLLTSFLVPFPSLKDKGRAENSKLPGMAWSLC